MLCPRCNSENELKDKFCRFCGAPLYETEVFIDPKEKKRQEKILKKQERLNDKMKQKQNLPKRTYSLNENVHRNSGLNNLLSIIKSLIILAILIVVIYIIFNIISVKMAQNGNDFSVNGNKIPSINYVVGERKVEKVKRSFDNHIFKTEYIFIDIDKSTDDILKYISYLMDKNSFQIIKDFDPSLENGTAKIATNSQTKFEDMVVLEIKWEKNKYHIITYSTKSTLPKTNN